MNKTLLFAKRNLKELSRDVLSYIFCIAFPVVMLVIMSVLNSSIPKEAGMSTFRIDNLSGGIIVFGQTFVMLFTAILVATDKCTSFLTRLYASPMKSGHFTHGYIIPMVMISIVQSLVTIISSIVVSLISGVALEPLGLVLVVFTSLPSALMFISIGMIFGTLFNEKAAPGFCSIIISLGTFLGGVFFDAEGVGGVMHTMCECMPFLYCTRTARSSIQLNLDWEHFGSSFLIVSLVAAFLVFLATAVFNSRMKADNK